MTPAEKRPYNEQAEAIRLDHLQRHPTYKYKPNRRATQCAGTAQSAISLSPYGHSYGEMPLDYLFTGRGSNEHQHCPLLEQCNDGG